MPQQRDIKGMWERTFQLDRATVNQDARTVELALSSEAPYERYYGMEVLGHGPGEVDMARITNAAALLMDHNSRDQIGVVESARLDPDRVLRCVVRFSRSARGEEIYQDVLDGIRTKVSVGYVTSDYTMTKGQNGGPDTYRFTGWLPCEASIVSIPADDTVGIGRGLDPDESRTTPPNPPAAPAATAKESSMTPEDIAAAQKAAEDLKNSIPGLLTGERREALQIQLIAEKLGLGKEAAEILASDKPLSEARMQIMALVAEKGAQPLPALHLDMSQKEAKQYSYARAIFASACRRESISFARCFEDEVSETIQKSLPPTYQSKGGMFVPMSLRAGLDTATATSGAELKYTEFGGEVIELLRNMAAVIVSGARVLPGLTSPISFPKQTGAGTAYWMGENGGADATESELATGVVTLAPKTLQATTKFSRQLLQQSVIAIEPMVRADLAATHALAIDRAALHGTGANNQPTGIYRTTSVNAKAMGGVPDFGKIQDMITAVATNNALMRSLGWLTTPGMAGKLAQTLKASAAGSDMIWTGKYDDGMLNGYKAIATNQVSALMNVLVDTGGTSHGMIFGNWDDLLIGLWGALELITDPYALAAQGMIKVTSFQMADIEVRHAPSFSVATGAAIA
jgi:HK97 family phage major capsid protein